MNAPTRPALRYHGGKWLLAPWIVQHLPPHRVYVEPFGGAASVLLRKPRSYAEVYNDLDREVVGLFEVLRDPATALRLSELLDLTPFARDEFEGAYEPCEDGVERARRLIVRSFMGFGADGYNTAVRTGFRADSNKSGSTPAHDWMRLPGNITALSSRLRGVVIENRPALDVIGKHDRHDTLHYVDPPYLPDTRSAKSRRSGERYHAYRHEMTIEDHEILLAFIQSLKGMVVLSGYPSPLYDDALAGWLRVDRLALADGARARTEVLWINQAAATAMRGFQPALFGPQVEEKQ